MCREAGRPLFVSLLVYLDREWPREHDAETLFLDTPTDTGQGTHTHITGTHITGAHITGAQAHLHKTACQQPQEQLQPVCLQGGRLSESVAG